MVVQLSEGGHSRFIRGFVMVLVRKISRSKWGDPPPVNAGSVPADAITADLRTHGNALSFWRCERPGDAEDLMRVALTLVAAPSSTSIEAIDLVWISESEITGKNLRVENSTGITALRGMAGEHRDLLGLTYGTLGQLGSLVAGSLQQGRHKRLTKKLLGERLVLAMRRNEIDPGQLDPRMREYISKHAEPKAGT